MTISSWLPSNLDISCPPGLPIAPYWEKLRKAIEDNRVVIVIGETGCGKTTQLPKIAIAAGRGRQGRIVCTQPRRVAAIAVASRLSAELGETGLAVVGYKVRFRDRTPKTAIIKFVTDGMLLAELQSDPRLRTYDTVILDEAHERSLNIDILTGVIKGLMPSRPELKLIISSATLHTQQFLRLFPDAEVVKIEGRGHPVDIIYRPFLLPGDEAATTPEEQVAAAIDELLDGGGTGDVLAFLATERQVIEATRLLKSRWGRDVLILPMFGRLSFFDQQRIFAPSHQRKIVIATNIAETSLTIPGIRYVVDSGLARMLRYNIRTRTTAMPVVPISKASAEQRAGRAGRTGPGICIRLYSREDFEHRHDYTPPEILRSNLAEVILKLISMGIKDVSGFAFLDPPSEKAIKEGFDTLKELSALDRQGRITPMGRLMARLPLDPRIARIIIQAERENALREAIIVAAALGIQDPRERPAEKEAQADRAHSVFIDQSSDFASYIKIWNFIHEKRQAGFTKNQIRRLCKDNLLSFQRIEEWMEIHDQILDILIETGGFHLNDRPAGFDALHRSILAGFLSRIAFLNKKESVYAGARGTKIQIFPGSGLFKRRPRWIVAAELVRTSQLFARTVAQVRPEWIEELAGPLAQREYSDPHWERARGEVMAWECVTVFGLVVAARRPVSYSRINPQKAREIFISQGLATCNLKGDYPFLTHNRQIISDLEGLVGRIRRRDIYEKDTAATHLDAGLKVLEEASGLGPISDERTLARAIRLVGDLPLFLDRDAILKDIKADDIQNLFPGHLNISGQEIELVYSFSPGNERDGLTARIPLAAIGRLRQEDFQWLVPGFLPEKVDFLLRGLPKEIRNKLIPIVGTTDVICRHIEAQRDKSTLFDAIEATLHKLYDITVTRDQWPDQRSLPPHLVMRFEVIDDGGRPLAAGRDLEALRMALREKVAVDLDMTLGWLRRCIERPVPSLNDLPDLPEQLS
ncbi:MAG: ATP-dependent RNA helicase HrpA, partial [Dissulfurimicrobium hydrothermale]